MGFQHSMRLPKLTFSAQNLLQLSLARGLLEAQSCRGVSARFAWSVRLVVVEMERDTLGKCFIVICLLINGGRF